eukprot:8349939-Prorocentrum_lima.AAC.1
MTALTMNAMTLTTSHCVCKLVVDAQPIVGVSSLEAITWRSPAGTVLKCGDCARAIPGGDPPTPPCG